MGDSHIDAFETVIYGRLSCIEMRRTVLPLSSRWASTVESCIELQEAANARMEAILARVGGPKVDEDEVAKVTNTFVRFGSWLDSLENRPLDPAKFFGAEAPSVVGRARLSKLTGRLEHMINTWRLTPKPQRTSASTVSSAGSPSCARRTRSRCATATRSAMR
jgi:hypothetical protein